MIYISIVHSDGNREMRFTVESMKELIDYELPSRAPKLKNELKWIKMSKQYKKNPKKYMKQERDSGWYYDC